MKKHSTSSSRRRLLAGAGAFAAMGSLGAGRAIAAGIGSSADLGFAELPDGALAEQLLEALPGKVKLIKKTFRPPNFETPIEYFRTPITPNNAFFVRYHLAGIPKPIQPRDWSLTVGGDGAERPLKLTLDELRKGFPAAQVTAVNQCSGNRRGLF